jgi:hypothetical protein
VDVEGVERGGGHREHLGSLPDHVGHYLWSFGCSLRASADPVPNIILRRYDIFGSCCSESTSNLCTTWDFRRFRGAGTGFFSWGGGASRNGAPRRGGR